MLLQLTDFEYRIDPIPGDETGAMILSFINHAVIGMPTGNGGMTAVKIPTVTVQILLQPDTAKKLRDGLDGKPVPPSVFVPSGPILG